MIALTETAAAAPVTLDQIDRAAKTYRAVFDRAEKLKAQVEREQQAVLNSHASDLDILARDLQGLRAHLESVIEHGRQHFKKPKTQTMHRIIVGFEKSRDKITYPDDEVLIPRIETMLKAKAATLIHTVKTIVREALKRLPKAELQSLGCKFVNGADDVVIRPETSSDVEKYFAARLTAAGEKN